MTKSKWLTILLLCSFLFVYLEWGRGNHAFIFQVEYLILSGNTNTTDVFMHPLVALPFVGQLVLIFSLFQKQPHRKLLMAGIILMGMLVAVCLLVGILSKNPRIAGSTVTYIILAWMVLKSGRKTKALEGAD